MYFKNQCLFDTKLDLSGYPLYKNFLTLPDIEYSWNATADDWDVYLIWAEEGEVLIQIYPPYLDIVEGEPIFPPPPPDQSATEIFLCPKLSFL